MGINEFAGYLAVGLVAFLTGIIAHKHGVTPYPFYLGLGIAIVGLLLSWFFVKDTVHHVQAEQSTQNKPEMSKVFVETSFKNPTLSAITQAGLVNNLNDGMIWGLLPVLLANFFMDEAEIGLIVAIYPTVWGLGQLVTGKMGDLYSKKKLLVMGMAVQAPAILLLPFVDSFSLLALISVVLGLGTALVYPNFLSAIAEATSPIQRAESIGSFRLWRDLGYAIGAILSGVLADLFGLEVAIVSIGVLTALSAFVLQVRMTDT
jgi:predicted MFS family arabinose efflux permease